MSILVVLKHELYKWTHVALRIGRVHSTKDCALFKIRKAIKEYAEHPLNSHSNIEEHEAQGVCENNIATERLWFYFYTIIGQSAVQTSELVRRCSLACARVIYTRGSVYSSIVSSYVLHHVWEYMRQ